MNTKILMIISAVFMALLGITVSFIPQEILAHFGGEPDGVGALMIQITGALYFGFAMLNWMARSNLIGGIYSRPVAAGNFLHFMMGAIVLLKTWITDLSTPTIIAGAGAYALFAVAFGVVLFNHPMQEGACS